jgi:beta-lactamase regulating signal transducer with metallopeptidase domain
MNALMSLDTLARFSAERMLNSVVEGLAVALLAWAALRVTGWRNSNARFAVWFLALLSIAALPWLGALRWSGTTGPEANSSPIVLPAHWALLLFVIWAVIAALALIRVGVGMWQVQKLRSSCRPVDVEGLDPLLRATLQEFRSHRAVEFCVSDQLQVPTAIGFRQPMVVVPAWALQELSATELNSILIHELAHLRRRDDWTNLAQKIIRALFFFHPAVWWIESKLSLEREMACDDVVLAKTANPHAYARCLVSMAEKSFLRRGLAMAQAAVGRMRQTSLRVAQIVSGGHPATRVWKPAAYVVAVFSVAGVVGLARAPQLVAFQDATVAQVHARSSGVYLGEEFGAAAIPAAFHPAAILKTKQAVAHRKAANESVHTKLAASRSPQVVQAKVMAETNRSTRQTVLVMMQTDQSGQPVWTICVWRVTVTNPGPVNRIPANKI